jgi:hypothetical protein
MKGEISSSGDQELYTWAGCFYIFSKKINVAQVANAHNTN